MKQYTIQKYTLKNKMTQNLLDAKTTPTPSHVCRDLRSPFRSPSTAAWGIRPGGLRRRPSNTNRKKSSAGTGNVVQEVVRRWSRCSQRNEPCGGEVERLGALFSRPVGAGIVLGAGT